MVWNVVVALAAIMLGGQASPTGDAMPPKQPRRIRYVAPDYPREAADAGLAGVVLVKCDVGRDGKVLETTIVEGESPLAEATLKAAKQWRYEPLLVAGKPTEFAVTASVRFDGGGKITVSGLIDSLKSPHEAVRTSAATWLGRVQAGPQLSSTDVARATHALQDLIKVEKSPRVSAAANDALTRLKGR